jgi:hypothetical protein
MACVLTPEGKQIRKFGTMTRDLLMLSDWLTTFQVTHVADTAVNAPLLRLPIRSWCSTTTCYEKTCPIKSCEEITLMPGIGWRSCGERRAAPHI